MPASVVLLNPADEALVTIDWSDMLGSLAINGSVSHTVPSPLTKMSESTDAPNKQSQVKIKGMVHGGLYQVSAQATLTNAEILNKTFVVRAYA